MGAGARKWRSLALPATVPLLPRQQVVLTSRQNSARRGLQALQRTMAACLLPLVGTSGGCAGMAEGREPGEEQGTRTEGPGAYCRDRLSVFLSFPARSAPTSAETVGCYRHTLFYYASLYYVLDKCCIFYKPKARSLPNPRKRL